MLKVWSLIGDLITRDFAASCLIPVAPLGQGAFAVLKLGKVAAAAMEKLNILDEQGTRAGTHLYVLGWFTSLILWSYGLCWLVIGISCLARGRIPFKLGSWAHQPLKLCCPVR